MIGAWVLLVRWLGNVGLFMFGGEVSCRGVAVVGGVDIWWCVFRVGVGGCVIDVCWQAV